MLHNKEQVLIMAASTNPITAAAIEARRAPTVWVERLCELNGVWRKISLLLRGEKTADSLLMRGAASLCNAFNEVIDKEANLAAVRQELLAHKPDSKEHAALLKTERIRKEALAQAHRSFETATSRHGVVYLGNKVELSAEPKHPDDFGKVSYPTTNPKPQLATHWISAPVHVEGFKDREVRLFVSSSTSHDQAFYDRIAPVVCKRYLKLHDASERLRALTEQMSNPKKGESLNKLTAEFAALQKQVAEADGHFYGFLAQHNLKCSEQIVNERPKTPLKASAPELVVVPGGAFNRKNPSIQYNIGENTVTIWLKGDLSDIKKHAVEIHRGYEEAYRRSEELMLEWKELDRKYKEADAVLSRITDLQDANDAASKLELMSHPPSQEQEELVIRLMEKREIALAEATYRPYTDLSNRLQQLYEITYIEATIK
jgi:hypothetical protein